MCCRDGHHDMRCFLQVQDDCVCMWGFLDLTFGRLTAAEAKTLLMLFLRKSRMPNKTIGID